MAERTPEHTLRPGTAIVDGLYVAQIENGMLVDFVPLPTSSGSVVPLTTVVGGVPDLVFDADGELVVTPYGA